LDAESDVGELSFALRTVRNREAIPASNLHPKYGSYSLEKGIFSTFATSWKPKGRIAHVQLRSS